MRLKATPKQHIYPNTVDLQAEKIAKGYYVPSFQGGLTVTSVRTNSRETVLSLNKVGEASKGFLKNFLGGKNGNKR